MLEADDEKPLWLSGKYLKRCKISFINDYTLALPSKEIIKVKVMVICQNTLCSPKHQLTKDVLYIDGVEHGDSRHVRRDAPCNMLDV